MDPFVDTTELMTPAGPLLLRPLRLGDEADLLAFHLERLSDRSRDFFRPHDTARPDVCLQQFADRIRRHAAHEDLSLVVEQDGAIVGYCFLWRLDRDDGRFPMLGIAVADALHGRGVGAAMMDALIDRARRIGLPGIYLTHSHRNERAGRLYQSRGFTYTGHEYREHTWSGEHIEREMQLVLDRPVL
jgi:RimJ/RimL family protein N-acetyltransferase